MKLSEIKSTLVEADAAPAGLVELKDLVADHDLQYAKKYIRALWDKDRVSYHGRKVESDLYPKIEAAAHAYVKDGFEVNLNLPVHYEDFDEISWQARVDDMQEVYLGYSPKTDKLYIGFDAWVAEEDFNEAWDKEFEQATGEEFDHENEEHAAAFDKVWKEYQNMTMLGLLFEVDIDGDNIGGDMMGEVSGGFYGREGKSLRAGLDLIDIRLD